MTLPADAAATVARVRSGAHHRGQRGARRLVLRDVLRTAAPRLSWRRL
ncbi:hypothetical protein [Streptomyces sp. NPDC059165]